MKFVAYLLLFVGLCCFNTSFAAKKTIAFNVITKGKIDKPVLLKSLKKEVGILKVKISVKNALLTITYDDQKTTPEQLMSYLSVLGYYATPLGENCANKPDGCLNNKSVLPNTMR